MALVFFYIIVFFSAKANLEHRWGTAFVAGFYITIYAISRKAG